MDLSIVGEEPFVTEMAAPARPLLATMVVLDMTGEEPTVQYIPPPMSPSLAAIRQFVMVGDDAWQKIPAP